APDDVVREEGRFGPVLGVHRGLHAHRLHRHEGEDADREDEDPDQRLEEHHAFLPRAPCRARSPGHAQCPCHLQFPHEQMRGSVASVTFGSHILISPPLVICSRMHRTVPEALAYVQAISPVPSGSTWISAVPASGGETRPRPLKVIAPPTALVLTSVISQVMPAEVSRASHFWMMRGAVVGEGAALQAPAGLSRLTTQLGEPVVPPVAMAQLEVMSLTNWKRTGALSRSASARAS